MEIIVALDFKEENKLQELLKSLHDFKPFYKVGMELFYYRPNIVKELKEQGHKVFLDLKLHDIPNTVEKALSSLKALNPDLINVHALGGKEMMERAGKVFHGTNTKIIAVTQLTSSDDESLKTVGINTSVQDSVVTLATLTKACGLHGVVASAFEVPWVKEHLGKNFLTITPGIRFEGNDINDQKRVVTPKNAKLLGSDYIVVGRPITGTNNPAEIYQQILKDIQ